MQSECVKLDRGTVEKDRPCAGSVTEPQINTVGP